MSEHDACNRMLAEAITRIEGLAGNTKYQAAWKVAARVLKDMLVERNTLVPDKSEQIRQI